MYSYNYIPGRNAWIQFPDWAPDSSFLSPQTLGSSSDGTNPLTNPTQTGDQGCILAAGIWAAVSPVFLVV